MPNKQAAVKALRQTKKHTLRNTMVKNGVEILIRKARKAITDKSKDASDAVRAAIKSIDRASQKGVLKAGSASRYKSRLMKALQSVKS